MTDGEFLRELILDLVKLTGSLGPQEQRRQARSIRDRAEYLPQIFQTPQVVPSETEHGPQVVQVVEREEEAGKVPLQQEDLPNLPTVGADTPINQTAS